MVKKNVLAGIFVLVFFLSCVCGFAQDKFYQNDALGIKMDCPSGWHMISGEEVTKGVREAVKDMTDSTSIKESVDKVGILVVFSSVPYGEPVEYASNITIAREPCPPDQVPDSLKYAQMSLLAIRQVFKDVKITQEPQAYNLQGVNGSVFEYGAVIVRGYLETSIRSRLFLFLKDGYGYVVSFTAKEDEFPQLVGAYNEALKTLVVK